MIIHFIRHGHPNYQNDCLTELGKKQATAAAERLRDCGIQRIYSSPKGRAMETASYTADALGQEITVCEFMKELSWRSSDGEPILANGHPWEVAGILASQGVNLSDTDWRSKEPYCRSLIVERIEKAVTGFDGFLAELGYVREGEQYRVVGESTDTTIAIFSHAGSSSAVLSHLLNIPFPLFCGAFPVNFTSVTTIRLSNRMGALFCPKMILFNDARHIEGITVDNVYGS